MRLKLGFLLLCCLLACLCACRSNNNPASQSSDVYTSTNTQANQNGVAPSAANNAGTAPDASSSPANQAAVAAAIDACSLMTTKEVGALQGNAIIEAKGNQRGDGDFLMSQCFYTAQEFVNSVSLTVIQPNPANPSKQPKQYFTEKFREAGKKPEAEREKEREREREKERKGKEEKREAGGRGEEEEEEEGANAERVGGVGEDAYWVKTGPTAALYVLKNNQFLILSIGGDDAEPLKLKKTKALAQQALKRLK